MSHTIRSFVLFSLLPLLILYADPETTRIDFYYGIAQGNYLIGDLEGAAKGVEQMLKLDPNYTPALTLNARILLDLKQPALALSTAEKALKLDPENSEHKLLKALVLGNLNRREEAIQVVEAVVQSAPVKSKHHRVASKLLGLLLMAEGNPNEAAQVFNQSYLNNPETAQGNLVLAGDAYLQTINQALLKNDFHAALNTTDKALELLQGQTNGDITVQQNTQLHILRARILTQAGRTNEAIKDLQVLMRKQPDNLEAILTLASLCATTENWILLQDILPSIAATPEFQDIALYLEGRIAIHNGRAGTAREAFELGLRILSDRPGKLRASMRFYRGVCLMQLGRPQEGDEEIIQSLDDGFRPETEKEVILASRTLVRARKTHQAIALLEAITLNRVTQSTEAWNLLGRAHHAEGSITLSLSAFNQSLSIQSDQPETLALRGTILRKLGDLEGAAADIQKALALDPANPAFTYSLGLIYLQSGDLTLAQKWIAKSAKKLPDDPGIHLLHAHLAYNVEAYRKAQNALETYLRLVPEKTNESAFYLEYALIAQRDRTRALDTLGQRIAASKVSPLLENFLDYARSTLSRKALLDAAGHAESAETAQRQLCEATYWIAQHERIDGNHEKAQELLRLTLQIGSPDYPEYQFAQWQLSLYRQRSSSGETATAQ